MINNSYQEFDTNIKETNYVLISFRKKEEIFKEKLFQFREIFLNKFVLI